MSRTAETSRWGYPMPVWVEARDELRHQLVRLAEERRTAAYSELCEGITAGRFRAYSWSFMALLDEACREEDARTGAILATLAVRKDTGRPGEGYFNWAQRTGLLRGDRESFWTAAAECVWDAYSGASRAAGHSVPEGSCHTESLEGAARHTRRGTS